MGSAAEGTGSGHRMPGSGVPAEAREAAGPARRTARASAVLAGVVVVLALAVAVTVGGRPLPEGGPAPPSDTPTGTAAPRDGESSPAPSGDGPTDPSATDPPAPATEQPGPLEGLHVVLDPGHNGGNAEAPARINELVGDGRGGMKACNTVGTAATDGYPEHAFTLDVALRTRSLLETDGARVTMTREDDDGVGPCVDERGRSAQEAGADVLVSIHADGADDPTVAGYFVIVSDPPVHEEQGEPSLRLAQDLLGALGTAGFEASTLYPEALSRRADLATLNWAQRPAVLLELAQMRNPREAEVAASPAGRQRYAEAVAAGIRAWWAEPDTSPEGGG